MMIRLDKYLADMGIGTRSEVKKEIRKGLVTVDGVLERSSDKKIDAESQTVSYQNNIIGYSQVEYYMLNKPAGVISASSDKKETTVLDLIKSKKRKDLFPVGRLDRDTEGLLLITNDGDLAHRLLSPKKHVDKIYYAIIKGCVTNADILKFEEGVDIGEKEYTRPAKLKIIKAGLESEIELTIQEGKFHQVKRMFEAIEKEVIYLKRISMGSLVLDETLMPGEYRILKDEEIKKLC